MSNQSNKEDISYKSGRSDGLGDTVDPVRNFVSDIIGGSYHAGVVDGRAAVEEAKDHITALDTARKQLGK